MSNEWIHRALGNTGQIILFMSIDETRVGGSPFQIGIHPGLRHLEQGTIERIIEGLTQGVELLRSTPMDDLVIIHGERK